MARTKGAVGRPKALTEKDLPRIVEAIRGSRGVVKTIAARLHVAYDTASNFLKSNPQCKVAIEAETEASLDDCEVGIFAAIDEGDTNLMKWWLSKKGKARGFGDDVVGGGGYDVEMVADTLKGQLALRIAARQQLRSVSGDDFVENDGKAVEED